MQRIKLYNCPRCGDKKQFENGLCDKCIKQVYEIDKNAKYLLFKYREKKLAKKGLEWT
jgi:NMD protein affecting ribosome stability and mRNA decay